MLQQLDISRESLKRFIVTFLKNFFALFLAFHNCIECGLIPNLCSRNVLKALFKMFGSPLIIGNNLFAIYVESITFIFVGQKQLCFYLKDFTIDVLVLGRRETYTRQAQPSPIHVATTFSF